MKQTNSQKQQDTLRKKFLKLGVKMSGPETIFFSDDTKIGKRVIIEPYVVIGSKVKIGFLFAAWLRFRQKVNSLTCFVHFS